MKKICVLLTLTIFSLVILSLTMDKDLKSLAESGDVNVQYELGMYYLQAEDDKKDYEKAFYWFQQAAKGGQKEAITWLGLCYYAGYGVTEDSKKAVEYFSTARKAGSSNGAACLAWCYMRGFGVKVNNQIAYSLLSHATSGKSKNPTALYLLGEYYMWKSDYPSILKACNYYKAAATASHPVGEAMLRLAYRAHYYAYQGIDTGGSYNKWLDRYSKTDYNYDIATILSWKGTTALPRITPDTFKTNDKDVVHFGAFTVDSTASDSDDLILVPDSTTTPEDTKAFHIVERLADFPGGINALMAWLGTHIKYPAIAQENGIEGRVLVEFVVSRTGAVRNISISHSIDPNLDKEAIRVVRSMPKWIPAKQDGQLVNCKFTLPITFRLS